MQVLSCYCRLDKKHDNEDPEKLPRRLRNEILSLSVFFNPILLCEKKKIKRNEREKKEKWPSPLEKYSHKGVAVSTQGWILTRA